MELRGAQKFARHVPAVVFGHVHDCAEIAVEPVRDVAALQTTSDPRRMAPDSL